MIGAWSTSANFHDDDDVFFLNEEIDLGGYGAAGLKLYVRTSCTDAKSQVLCSEVGGSKEKETLTLDVTAGLPYWFFVDGFKGDAGAYSIDFTLTPG